MKNRPCSRLCVLITMLSVFGLPLPNSFAAYADKPKIVASVTSDSIFIGESVDLQIEVQNVEEPKSPDLSALKEEFDVQSVGDQSRNQSSTYIINGRVSQQNTFSHIYLFKLTPKRAGKLSIPAIAMTVDSRQLISNSIEIDVQDAAIQDVVLMEIVPSRRKLYPSQSFAITLKVLVRPLPYSNSDPLQALRKKPPQLTVGWIDSIDGLQAEDKSDWLRPLLSKNGVGFAMNDYSTQSGSLFDSPRKALFDLKGGREKRKDLAGEEVEYFVYELTRNFTAERTGTYAFGPASVKGTFVTGSDGTEYEGKRIVTLSTVVDVVVEDVPSNRPESFTGGIGSFRVKTTASPNTLRVGDPMTLAIEFERTKGAGLLEQIAAPKLSANVSFAEDFDIIDTSPTGRMEGTTKTFSFGLRPKRAGVSIPSLIFSSFDPETETFVEIASAPIALNVKEASAMSSSEVVGLVPKASNTALKQNDQGIYGNMTDRSALVNESPRLGLAIGIVASSWGMAGFGLGLMAIRRRQGLVTQLRRGQRAKSTALQSLRNARANKDIKETVRSVRSALLGLVADVQGRNPDGMTFANLSEAMEQSGAANETQENVKRFIQRMDSFEYGGSSSMQSKEWIDEAEKIVIQIAPLLQSRSAKGHNEHRE
jgi:hypothetical protein